MNRIIIYTDGASRGNPGNAAIAYIISGIAQKDIEFGQKIGITTNNQAEYRALLAAITKLLELKPQNSQIACFADSELMVKQLNGEYKVKDLQIKPHYSAILEIKDELVGLGNDLSFTAIRRSDNVRADKLANIALDD